MVSVALGVEIIDKEMTEIKTSTEIYLDGLIGKSLYKEDQKELIERLNIRDDRNRLQKKISTLNGYLIDNYNMTLISKRIRKEGDRNTIWLINNIE